MSTAIMDPDNFPAEEDILFENLKNGWVPLAGGGNKHIPFHPDSQRYSMLVDEDDD